MAGQVQSDPDQQALNCLAGWINRNALLLINRKFFYDIYRLNFPS